MAHPTRLLLTALLAIGVGTQGAPDSPVAVVDAFIQALNDHDMDALQALVYPDAQAFGMNGRSFEFESMEQWLGPFGEFPVPYLDTMYGPGAVGLVSVAVIERLQSGSFVTQRERLTTSDRAGDQQSAVSLVTYKVRDGKIREIWVFPDEPNPADVPEVSEPLHGVGEGPRVAIDAGHLNGHTADGTFWNVAELARRDGFRVRGVEGRFTAELLADVDILVSANAVPPPPAGGGVRDPAEVGSAFADDEIAVLHEWVAGGGRLLLVSDHSPMRQASSDLAAAFGIEIAAGRARRTAPPRNPAIFERATGTVRAHPITDGIAGAARVEAAATSGGHAFRAPTAQPLLVLDADFELVGDRRRPVDPPMSLQGWLQAAAFEVGDGRLVYFAEARVLWSYAARDNGILALNVLRWLAQGR